MSLLRGLHVRARREDGNHLDESLQRLYDDFNRLLNGDFRTGCIQHFCHEQGCCNGHRREVAIDDICAVLTEAYFGQLGVKLPATNKWWTFGPHLARQSGAILCHNILPRVAEQAFTCDVEDGGEEDNFHSTANQRKTAALEFLLSGATAKTLGLANICIGPIDYLSHRLQHLDVHGGSCLELIDPTSKGLMLQTQQALWELFNDWFVSSRSSHLASLRWVLAGRHEVDAGDMVADARGACVGLAAAVWARLELKYLPASSMLHSLIYQLPAP